MRRPTGLDNEENLASFQFVDRVPDSIALSGSLVQHMNRVRSCRIDSDSNPNVLTFYGIGGMGKTKLSQRLEHWLNGHLGDQSEWGRRPIEGAVATVRWDLDHGNGALDLVPMLLALRAALGVVDAQTPAFDLALAAYLTGVRPGETVELLSKSDTSGVLNFLESLASDLGSASAIAALGSIAVRRVVDVAVSRYRERRELARFDALGDVLRQCQQIPTGDPSPAVALELLWLLTEEIDAMAAADRPCLVIFVDTFEKIQQPNAIASEGLMNRWMASLPYALFVVTGREKLTWHEHRPGLKRSGSRAWPSLVDGRGVEPRQHLLGHLSDADLMRLIEGRRAAGGWPMDDQELRRMATKTRGFPLYVDAVCQMADNLTDDGVHVLTADQLGDSLPDLVRRLLAGLTDEQARAFQAACLLPYFDESLVMAVGQVSEGAVRQCIRRALVEPHQSALYPLKVHDEIRGLVRKAGEHVQSGWGERDWAAAASRGMTEARIRFDDAARRHDDVASLEALALGISVALAHDLPADWLIDAARSGPSLRGLSGRLPAVSTAPTTSDAVAMVQFIHALNDQTSAESEATLRQIFAGETAIAEMAGRWVAYRIREQPGRAEEALQVFDVLMQRFPERRALHTNQYSSTLRMARRFSDSIRYRRDCGLEPAVNRAILLAHGLDGSALRAQLDSAARQPSRRYGFEIEADAWVVEARFRSIPRGVPERLRRRAVQLGSPAQELHSWSLSAYAGLHDRDAFEYAFANVQRLARRLSVHPRPAVSRLLALRALATGDAADADRAWAEASGSLFGRGNAWIFAEFALELIDRPLPPAPTQWLDSESLVRQRWHSNIRALVERSARGEVLVDSPDSGA